MASVALMWGAPDCTDQLRFNKTNTKAEKSHLDLRRALVFIRLSLSLTLVGLVWPVARLSVSHWW